MVMSHKEIFDGLVGFYKGIDNLPGEFKDDPEASDKDRLYALIRHMCEQEECGMDMIRLIFKRAGVDESRFELLIVDAYGDHY